ncbi:hypothetical protein ACFFJT_17510 [Dyella flava]|uniref:Uncharacterized protein n=1 Tax=Dyella flava TaxID=1920170 RepID=A0ABS2K3F5_9GAMM|nr:hypothetical protein [Dyella flava]MBM7125686.1 hypothetical protein [Dyella flava]GLQ48798.1 hypothetical protein GCM10010872_02470 [Dyella flava]
MVIVCAFLLSVLGAVLLYLSHEQQRLLRRPLPFGARMAGTVIVFASVWIWWAASGVAAGIAGTLTSLMLAWVALPYLAWWRDRRAVAARAQKR